MKDYLFLILPVTGLLAAGLVIFIILYWLERQAHRRDRLALDLERTMDVLDAEMRSLRKRDPELWPRSPEAQSLLRQWFDAYDRRISCLNYESPRDHEFALSLGTHVKR